ncbi:MAG: tRNA glutamyl-Q(34) synthetase GluQRS [Pseudomonadota bacterium]
MATADPYTGRFAPSPTGRLHLGSLVGALVSYFDARHHGGLWLLRIEDIDPPREVPGAAADIVAALASHGLHHDGECRYQSTSRALHDAAIEALLASGDAYYCQCSRRQLRAAGHGNRYPGICRDRDLSEGAVRVRVPNEAIVIRDRWQPEARFDLDEKPGDFIVRRGDGLIAYQLAVVVDDADQGVTDVVRGVDLFDSTARQIWLQQLLGMPQLRYAHFPVLLGNDGRKLSKQTGAPELSTDTPLENLTRALQAMGMPVPGREQRHSVESLVAWALERYEPDALRGQQSFANKA